MTFRPFCGCCEHRYEHGQLTAASKFCAFCGQEFSPFIRRRIANKDIWQEEPLTPTPQRESTGDMDRGSVRETRSIVIPVRETTMATRTMARDPRQGDLQSERSSEDVVRTRLLENVPLTPKTVTNPTILTPLITTISTLRTPSTPSIENHFPKLDLLVGDGRPGTFTSRLKRKRIPTDSPTVPLLDAD
jgi:hypothetical protein